MKQYQINKAYAALGRLANMQLRVRDSRNLYMLSKQLENAYNFELEQEKKLIEKYHGDVTSDGRIHFGDTSDAEGFKQEIGELNNLDIEVEFDPIIINCDDIGDQRITPYDVACLDGFVSFE